jgi:hypothetical protein
MKKLNWPRLLTEKIEQSYVDSIYELRALESHGSEKEIGAAKRKSMDLEAGIRRLKHGY